MYEIDARDWLRRVTEFPRASVGAPSPLVVATDVGVLTLAYRLEDGAMRADDAGPAPSGSLGDEFGVVTFQGCKAHSLGPPNDEAIRGHPLAERGLKSHGTFEVMDSSWIRLLERRNRVHPRRDPDRYRGLHHLILCFHDSTFECVGRTWRSCCWRGPDGALLTEVARQWGQREA